MQSTSAWTALWRSTMLWGRGILRGDTNGEYALKAGLLVDLYVVIRRRTSPPAGFTNWPELWGARATFEVVSTGRWSVARGALNASTSAWRSSSPAVEGPGSSVPDAYAASAALRQKLDACHTGGGLSRSCFPQSWGNILNEPVRKIWQRMGRFPHKGRKVCPMRK